MALATQCPHCSTTFRVAADQLKLRGGIVRCGACHEVFDGNASLVDLDQLVADAPPPTPPSPSAEFDAQVAEIEAREAAGAEPIYTLDFDNTFDPFGILPKIEGPPAPPPEPDVIEEVDHSMQAELPLEHAPDAEPEPESEPAAPPQDGPAPPPLDIDFTLDLDPPAAAADADKPDTELLIETPPKPAEQEIYEELGEAPAARAVRRRGGRARPPAPRASAGPAPQDGAEAEVAAEAAADTVVDHELHLDQNLDHFEEFEYDPAAAIAAAAAAEAQAADGEALAADGEAAPDAPAEPDHDEPEFVKRARRDERLGRARRNLMIAASVVLAIGLAVQGVTTFRNVLAARYPQLNPLLASACAKLGCRLELPAVVDTLAIETGELQTLGEDTFSLSTLVRNQGVLAQAWPHLELVLTDANDKALLRRVLAPSDYLPPSVVQAKGFAAHSEQSVKLYFAVSQLKASGYRIAVFYP